MAKRKRLAETQFLVAFFVCGLSGGRLVVRVRARVFITTFNNISVKSWRKLKYL
jgi:hypothetical protein